VTEGKRKPGRHTLEETQPQALEDAVNALADGFTKLEAAAIAGISYNALRERIKQSDAFAARVAAVQARKQRRYLNNIDHLADHCPEPGPRLNANVKALEMQWPDKYAKRSKVEVGPAASTMTKAEILAELREELAALEAEVSGGEE